MADARHEFEWAQTSSLMALIANCHRDPKKGPLEPEDCLPKAGGRREEKMNLGHDISVLKVFVDKRPGSA